MDRRLLSSQLQHGSSRRSVISMSESEGGSLLSGLSQARKIPNRRGIPEESNNGNRNKNRNGKLSRSAPRDNGVPKAIRGSTNNNTNSRRRGPDRDAMKQKNEVYRKQIDKIVKLQAFARGYITRFAYQSRITMENTKKRFFVIQIQANVRGFLERQRYAKLTNKKRPAKKTTSSSSKPTGGDKQSSTPRSKRGRNHPSGGDTGGLGSPKQARPQRGRHARNAPKKATTAEDDSERHDGSFRIERFSAHKSDRKARKPNGDPLGESESDLGSSVMSNLSYARKVPDRRRKHEDKEMDDSSHMGSVMSNLSYSRKIPHRRRKQEDKEMDDASDMGSSVMSNLSYAKKVPDRRHKREGKELDDSSHMGSVMSNISNLSLARKVPDRRQKQEQKEKAKESKGPRKTPKKPKDKLKESKAVKIQALARGYIQRFLYKSTLAMEKTKKKYAAMMIQAYARGLLQRLHGPQVSRIHVAPRREPMAEQPARGDRETQANSRKAKNRKLKKNPDLHGDRMTSNSKPKQQKAMRKPVRHRSGSGDESFPKQLTIRKPRRQNSDTGEESHEAPVKQLTIRQPRQHRDDSDIESGGLPPIKVTTRAKNAGRVNEGNTPFSPPRKVMLRTKKPKRHDSDMEKSDASFEPDKGALNRRDRRTLMAHASDSRFGESVSDVGSLISELSNARKVPDRRRVGRELGGPRARGTDTSGRHGNQAARTKSAIKIQAIGRGYNARFAFKSRLIMEQTKKKYFAIQIQALARGFLARSRLKK